MLRQCYNNTFSDLFWFTLLNLLLISSNNISAFYLVQPQDGNRFGASTRSLASADMQSSKQASIVLLLPSHPPDALQEEARSISRSFNDCFAECNNASIVSCEVSTTNGIDNKSTIISTTCQQAKLVLALGIQSSMDVRYVATLFRLRRSASADVDKDLAQFALGGKPFAPSVGTWDEANPSWKANIPWTAAAQDRALMLSMQRLFVRGEREDYVQAIQLYINSRGDGGKMR